MFAGIAPSQAEATCCYVLGNGMVPESWGLKDLGKDGVRSKDPRGKREGGGGGSYDQNA